MLTRATLNGLAGPVVLLYTRLLHTPGLRELIELVTAGNLCLTVRVKIRLYWARLNAKRKLATFASGHSRVTSLAQDRPPIHQKFCLSEVTQREYCDRLQSFESCRKRNIFIASRCAVSCVNASLI